MIKNRLLTCKNNISLANATGNVYEKLPPPLLHKDKSEMLFINILLPVTYRVNGGDYYD